YDHAELSARGCIPTPVAPRYDRAFSRHPSPILIPFLRYPPRARRRPPAHSALALSLGQRRRHLLPVLRRHELVLRRVRAPERGAYPRTRRGRWPPLRADREASRGHPGEGRGERRDTAA